MTLLQATYFYLRSTGAEIKFPSCIDFEPGRIWISLFVTYTVVFPVTFCFLRKTADDIFAFLYTPLMLVGAPSGSVAMLYGDLGLAAIFIGFFMLLPFALLHLRRLPLPTVTVRGANKLPLICGFIGIGIYAYLAIKYRDRLHFAHIDRIYEVRIGFRQIVEGWELYAIFFAKSVGAFALAAYAVASRRALFLVGAFFILLVDYMLAAHKASLAFAVVIAMAYYFFAVRDVRYRPEFMVVATLAVLIATMFVYLSGGYWSYVALGVYDRIFNVTSGLFYRYYEYANNNHFFHGGSGFLGWLFGSSGENYQRVIGQHYFGPWVSANADIVSDAYINFGALGVVVMMLALRLAFTPGDDKYFRRHREVLVTFLFPFSFFLFSMGLQTALLTGGLFFALLLIKLRAFAAGGRARTHRVTPRVFDETPGC